MFFKPTLNTKLEEIRRYLPISSATSFSNISPFIQAAEVAYILPLLGRQLYELLTQFYESSGEMEGISPESKPLYVQLIEHIQRSLINLTYWSAFDFMNTLMNDAGFHRRESDTEKTLYKYQEESLKAGFKNNGFDALDTMLAYLEEHIADFPLFRESPNYTERRSCIIADTATFNRIFNINNSRLVFLKVARFMTQVEDFEIQGCLGAELYTRVKAEIIKAEPDEKILRLIPYLQKPIAHLSIAKASFQLGINVNDKGLFFESQDSTMTNSTKTSPLTDQQYWYLAKASEGAGMAYLEMLRGFLAVHPGDYPEYRLPSGSALIRDNSGKKSYWA
jgi:hypothetical protein